MGLLDKIVDIFFKDKPNTVTMIQSGNNNTQTINGVSCKKLEIKDNKVYIDDILQERDTSKPVINVIITGTVERIDSDIINYLTINGNCGTVLLNNGEISISNNCGPVSIGSGDLEVDNITAEKVEIITGDITVGCNVTGNIRIVTGDADVGDAMVGNITVGTGDVEIGDDVRGNVTIGVGDIDIGDDVTGNVYTQRGDINIEGSTHIVMSNNDITNSSITVSPSK